MHDGRHAQRRRQVSGQLPLPHQVKQTGSTRSRSPVSSAPRPRPPVKASTRPRYPRHQAAPVPVTRQPPHIRDHHRVEIPGPPVLPASGRHARTLPRTSPRPGREPGHPAGRRRQPLSRRPCGRKSPAHAAGTGHSHHATEARTAVMTPPSRRDRSPSASSDRVPARTQTRHGHPSWRNTTSPRSSASPSRTGTAGQAAHPRTYCRDTTTPARAASNREQPGTPARSAHARRRRSRPQPASSARPAVTRIPQERANPTDKTRERADFIDKERT